MTTFFRPTQSLMVILPRGLLVTNTVNIGVVLACFGQVIYDICLWKSEVTRASCAK